MAKFKVTKLFPQYTTVEIPDKDLNVEDPQDKRDQIIEAAEEKDSWTPPLDYGAEEFRIEEIIS